MRRKSQRAMAKVVHTHQRVVVGTATMVALISTVGAPFKWSMSWWPIPDV